MVERDKLAAELTEVYPPLAEKLADLVGRIAANDPAIERVNQKLPDGAKWLSNAELVGRQLSNFLDGPSNIPRITEHMRLPAFWTLPGCRGPCPCRGGASTGHVKRWHGHTGRHTAAPILLSESSAPVFGNQDAIAQRSSLVLRFQPCEP